MMEQHSQTPIDRRPIKSRNTWWAENVTALLIKSGVSPNAISLFGVVAAAAAAVAFASTDSTTGLTTRAIWFLGGLLCQVRLLCNLFDGMVAVERKMASATGELYNEVPDRISDASVMIGLGYSAGGSITLGYLAALVSVFVAYVRATAKSIGAPNDFCGPMAKPQRMALVTLLAVYMAFSSDSWRVSWGESKAVLLIVIVGGLITAWRRLGRAVEFLRKSNN